MRMASGALLLCVKSSARSFDMESCIYTGTIRHRRFSPRKNSFRYELFLVYLDLQECSTAVASSPFWSINKPNLAWFRRKDHFGDPSIALDQTVRLLVSEKTGIKLGGAGAHAFSFSVFRSLFQSGNLLFLLRQIRAGGRCYCDRGS